MDGKEQPLDKLTVEMFKKLNIELIYSSYRQILNKKCLKDYPILIILVLLIL